MRYQVLGPLRVWRGDVAVPVHRMRQRVMLAVLLLQPGRPASVDHLVAACWGSEPPATVRNQVQIVVHQLRSAFRAAGETADVLTREPAGYILHASPGQIDAARFEDLVADSRERTRTGDRATARDQLREALKLWQGDPFAGVESDVVAAAATRLAELRLTALEQCLELELALGRHREVVDEAAALVRQHGTRERLRGVLMLALYRSGRQTEALAAYRSGRELLAGQIGVEPGEALATLHEQILRADPGLHLPEPAAAVAGRPPGCQYDTLPRVPVDFTGRGPEVAQAVAALAADGAAAPVLAIDGMAGTGKTTLALRLAHLLADRAPDARLFVDLHGHSPGQAPVPPVAALAALLRQIGVTGDRVPDGVEERAALWRSEMAGRRALVVLDNAADTAQVLPLLPGDAGCLVLVTARRRLVGLDAAYPLSLDVLADADATALFTAVVGRDRAAAEPDAVAAVVARCGRLPLALRIAGARLRHRPMWTVGELAGRLADERRQLAELSPTGWGVAAAFALSYQQLTTPEQRMFRLFGHHVGDDLDHHLAAAALDLPPETAADHLEKLVDCQLVSQPTPGRYRQHDLLRRYAADLAAEPAGVAEHDGIVLRIHDYYLHTASAAADLLYPRRRLADVTMTYPPAALPPLSDGPDATRWFEVERANLAAAVEDAARCDRPLRVWWLTSTLWPFVEWNGYVDDWERSHRLAIAACEATGEDVFRAVLHDRLARALRTSGRLTEAAGEHRRALALCQATDDLHGEGRALSGLAMTYLYAGRHQEALAAQLAATDKTRASVGTGGGRGEYLPIALVNLAIINSWLGRHAEALRLCEQVLADDVSAYTAAPAHRFAGRAQLFRGDDARALWHLAEAEERFRAAGNGDGLAGVSNDRGLVHARSGRVDAALRCHRRAVDLARTAGNLRSECIALNDQGITLTAAGQPDAAADSHRGALTLARRAGLRYDEATAHTGLAAALATSDPAAAADHRRRAETILAELDRLDPATTRDQP